MKHRIFTESLTYDDLQIIPQFSNVMSRSNVSLTTDLSRNYILQAPYIASPMDTICGYEMALKMMKLGGVGCVHRFMSVDEQKQITEKLKENSKEFYDEWSVPIMMAVGVANGELSRASHLIKAGANVILIDVAHGHHQNVKDMVGKLFRFRELSGLPFDIIAGNVATKEAAEDLSKWGVDGLRANVGNGSLCNTRIQTGHGVPSVTSLINVLEGAKVPVIADGGIRYAGDIAKALGLGASTVMLGSLLAGTQETPGDFLESNGSLFKKYRGSASLETKISNNQEQRNIEGVSTTVPYKGGVKYVIHRLNDGIRSALSYSGAHTIEEFFLKAEFTKITNAGQIEAKPHGKL